MAATLQTFLNRTRRLLHDSLGRYWTDADLIDAINEAQRRTVADTKCYRQLQTVYLSSGLELYGYGSVSGAIVTAGGSAYTSAPAVALSAPPAGGTQATATAQITSGVVTQIVITNGGSGYTSAPTVQFSGGGGSGAAATASIVSINTMDVINITVLWGTVRTILDRKAFTRLQVEERSWQGYTQMPTSCAQYGQGNWYVAPIPDQFYVSEWDTVLIPPDLAANTDTSVISPIFEEPVPYYAAHIAKFKEQSYDESARFMEQYKARVLMCARAQLSRMLPSAYGS